MVRMLHHRIVDRDVRGGGEGGAVEAEEVEIPLRLIERAPAGGERLRMEPLHLGKQERRREEEDAAVPDIVARVEIGPGPGAVGLLDEARDVVATLAAGHGIAAADIAIAGLGPVRRDAEGDEPAAPRRGGGMIDGGDEGGGVGDGVIGRHHQDQRVVRGRDQPERGHGDRRRGVAPHGFEHDRGRRDAGDAKLLGDDEAMLVVGDDDGRREARGVADPQSRLLQQRVRGHERQKLLRVMRARHWPQPRPRASRQDHRMDPRRRLAVHAGRASAC